MVTLAEIRDAIVDETQSLASILRKAKILAHKLDNKDFKDWVEWELTGYPNNQVLPNYRIMPHSVVGSGFSQWGQPFDDFPLQVPEQLKEVIIPKWTQGIPQIEKLNEDSNPTSFARQIWSTDKARAYSLIYPNLQFVKVEFLIPRIAITNILETVRDKLLNFVLELENLYSEDEPIPKPTTSQETQQVEQIVHTHITVNHNGGEFNMSTFDQRQQQVEGNQYNAARDINFGEVKTKEDFVDALNNLHKQVEDVQPVNDDETEIAVDIKANLEKAIVEAKKDNPDKGKIRKFLDKASEYAKTTASFAGMITIFHKAAEAIQALPFI